jgi:hypothetical protein
MSKEEEEEEEDEEDEEEDYDLDKRLICLKCWTHFVWFCLIWEGWRPLNLCL